MSISTLPSGGSFSGESNEITSVGTAPYSRFRKQSRSQTQANILIPGFNQSAMANMVTSPPVGSNEFFQAATTSDVGNSRRRFSVSPFSRKQSQVNIMPRSRQPSMATSSSLGNLPEIRQPALSDTRRMNVRDVMIWKKFTKNLRQRVLDRRSERRTFCWLDKSVYGDSKEGGNMQRMEPTYKTVPDLKPSQDKCRQLIDDYLPVKLKGVEYYTEGAKSSDLSREIADEIRAKVRSAIFPERYKCVVYVTLGQKRDQGIHVSSLCVWDQKSDSYISSSYENESLFCSVTVFAVYFE